MGREAEPPAEQPEFDEEDLKLQSEIRDAAIRDRELALLLGTRMETDKERVLQLIAGALEPDLAWSAHFTLKPVHGAIFLGYQMPNRSRRLRFAVGERRDMQEKNWDLTNEGLGFHAGDGMMGDGGHRSDALQGCNEGTEIDQVCTFGVKTFRAVDSGIVRKLADQLEMDGMSRKRAEIVATVANRMFIYENYGYCIWGSSGAPRMTRAEGLEYIDSRPEIAEAVEWLYQKKLWPMFVPKPVAAYACVALRRAAIKRRDCDPDLFFSKWATGADIKMGESIRALITRLQTMVEEEETDLRKRRYSEKRRRVLNEYEMLCLIFDAWNRWDGGTGHATVSRIQLPIGGLGERNFRRPIGWVVPHKPGIDIEKAEREADEMLEAAREQHQAG